jgi:PAS domain S-box-containing protein
MAYTNGKRAPSGLAKREVAEQNSQRSGIGMADGSDHEDAEPPVGGVDAASARRPRLSRPTPSHLFSQRKAEGPENGSRVRSTRVIPALARHAVQPALEAGEPAEPIHLPDVPDLPAEPAAPAEPAPASPAAAVGSVTDYPPDLVFIVRADGTVLYVNHSLGPRGEEDVIGSDFYDWVFPEQHALVREALGQVFGSGEAGGLELQGIQHHQPDAWYECRIAPNHREGKVVSATIIARDVTRYKRAEQGLKAEHQELRRLAEEHAADIEQLKAQLAQRPAERAETRAGAARFRALLDAAGEAVFITDPATETVVDVNETACRWIRRDRDSVRGQSVHTLGLEFPVIPPPALHAELTETRDSRRPLILQGVHRRQDGSTFPVEVAVATHAIGDESYVLAVVRDIKGRQRADEALAESEARYWALVEQSFDAVFLTTRGGEVVEANQPALELFGYEDGGLIGQDARSLLPRVDDIRRFQRVMAEAGIVRRLEVELKRQDGTTFPGLVSATGRQDGQGRLQGYQWVARQLGQAEVATSVTPPTAAVPLTGEVLLLVDGDRNALVDAKAALERLGPAVIAVSTAVEAVQQFRTHTPRIRLAVVGPVTDGAPEDLARELHEVYPQLRVILVTPEDPFGVLERAADLAVEACLRHPVHPLALVQSVREAMGELPGS